MDNSNKKIALITGGIKRVGATIARHLHAASIDLALHYHNSSDEAHELQAELQAQRPNSVFLLRENLLHIQKFDNMIAEIVSHYGRLDILVNNASSFFPTVIGQTTEEDWESLLGTNLKAPFFLSQAAAPFLKESKGCIVNLVDIHAKRPMKSYPVYSSAKAGLVMLTKSLAWELAPEVRVNAVAPGVILWHEKDTMDEMTKKRILSKIALKRAGSPTDIAQTVLFLIQANYVTGQVIAVDGGRTLNQ
jgi:pteridine reductase